MNSLNEASFSYELLSEHILAIFDNQGGASVTTDVNSVLKKIKSELGQLDVKFVVYQDSRGVIDQIRINEYGEFNGFYPLNSITLSEAVRKIGFYLH